MLFDLVVERNQNNRGVVYFLYQNSGFEVSRLRIKVDGRFNQVNREIRTETIS